MNGEVIRKKQEELIADLAHNIYRQMQLAEGDFHIALSGGNTPSVLFDVLAKDYANLINWDMVHVWWGDERCVYPTSLDSNFRMAKHHLLNKVLIPSGNIHRIKGELLPCEACEIYELEILKFVPALDSTPVFDLIILGMGEDGHIASIFPHEIELFNSNKLCVVATHIVTQQKRVSFTGRLINCAKQVSFLVSGEKKASIINDVVNEVGDYKKFPVSRVYPKNGELLFYIADK